MSAKKLYDRLVGRLYSRWAELYPMHEWVDPESAIDRIVDDLIAHGAGTVKAKSEQRAQFRQTFRAIEKLRGRLPAIF